MTFIQLLVAAAVLPVTYISLLILSPKSSPKRHNDDLQSVLIPSYTSHARLLPTPSKHAFSYPLIYLGVDIDALESGRLNLPMRLLAYGGRPWTKVLGLRSFNYLTPGEGSLHDKLEKLLASVGMERRTMKRTWMVTMPSMLGFESINPLTVWYVYDEDKKLSCVILEVHNTFGEKHAYVLQTSSEHVVDPNEGYTHAWIFPRTFHVSPFNSRNGYYRLDTIDPFASNASSSSSSLPQMKVFLRLLTPDKTTKLTAVVASHPTYRAIPLEPAQAGPILFALARWPAALFLATPRILYHAYILQYVKKLAMFPRPEPRSEGQEGVWNPAQNLRDGLGLGIGFQGVGGSEKYLGDVISTWADKRCREMGMGLRVSFRDEREMVVVNMVQHKDKDNDVVAIETSDPAFFTNLVAAPTPEHFLALAPERLTTISDAQAFTTFFSPSTPPSLSPDKIDRVLAGLRDNLFRWYLCHSTHTAPPDLYIYPSQHFTAALPRRTRIWLVWVLWLHVLGVKAEENVMYWIGARFVQGAEPWKIWERALGRLYRDAGRESREEKRDAKGNGADPDLEGWEDLGSVRYE